MSPCSAEGGSRLARATLVLLFGATGSVFLFASLPHTEVLRCVRRGPVVHCTLAQALAGRWELFSRSIEIPEGVRFRVARHEDEGSVTYRPMVELPSGKYAFGISKADRAEVERTVERINAFLADREAPRLELREDVFWWWLALPGGVVLAIAAGFAVRGVRR